jgi:hypothetical protein
MVCAIWLLRKLTARLLGYRVEPWAVDWTAVDVALAAGVYLLAVIAILFGILLK